MAAKANKKKSSSSPTPPRNRGNKSTNGVHATTTNKSNTTSSSISIASALLIAIIAFIFGILTPPSFHAITTIRNYQNDTQTTTTSSLSDIEPLAFDLPYTYQSCSKSTLDNYLHDHPVNGLHVVCIEAISTTDEVISFDTKDKTQRQQNLHQISSIQVTFYRGSFAAPLKRRIKLQGNIYNINWFEIKQHLIIELGLLPEGKIQQPWSLFTSNGELIVRENDIIRDNDNDKNGIGLTNKHVISNIITSGMIVITNGGNWVWPPVRDGFQRIVEVTSSSSPSDEKKRNITIETLSMKPLVLSISGFLSHDECDYIAKKATPSMQYSGVSLKDADKGKAASNWRTSQSTFLAAHDDDILKEIEHRTASLTRIPRSHQEYVQVLRYGTTEKYDAHHDYFDPASYQSDPNTLKLIEHGKKNRYATVFWYLTDVEEGGHTIFPRAYGLPPVQSHSDCTKGLKVKPEKGKVIIFYSLDASGRMDPLSLHGACPVIGEDDVKWAANKWIWNAPMGYVR